MSSGNGRWLRRGLIFDDELWQRLKARAEAEKGSISTLVRELLREAIEIREAGPGAVPMTKADQLVQATERTVDELWIVTQLVGAVGRSVIGMQHLLLHWATRENALGVNEDDLDAELQAVGAEGWAQVLDELRPPVVVDLMNKDDSEEPK
jgi:plasmid stability protein